MQVKVCGLCRPGDAALAVAAGATHAGVIRVPGTPRWRPVGEARTILDAAVGARRVGVFAGAAAGAVVEEAGSLGLDVVQLHGSEDPSMVSSLRAEGLEVWKVVKPADAAALMAAASRYAAADLLLLEGASTRGAGGVGARLDWAALASAREAIPATTVVGLAGGLTPENVSEAVALLRPSLVDVSSGVESRMGEKDEARVRAFVAAAMAAGAAVQGTEAR